MKPIFHIVHQRTGWDCSIAALASWLCEPYEEVLRVAAARYPVEEGLFTTHMMEVAKEFGVTFKRRVKRINLEEHEGLLGIRIVKEHMHSVVLFNGLIFDPEDQGTIWEAETYITTAKAKIVDLLVEEA